MTRRIVRASTAFFHDLDRQLGPDRGPHGEPSATDFLVIEVPAIVEQCATGFDTLPEADQILIRKLSREAQQEQRKLWYEMEEKSIKQIQDAGVEIVKILDKKPFQDAAKPVWDKYGAQHAALIQRIQDVK